MKLRPRPVRLAEVYYSPQGYWKGLAAIKKLATVAKVSESDARDWLKRQALWQIYLSAPRHIPRPKFDITEPNEAHQADLLFLPHDRAPRGKTYKICIDSGGCGLPIQRSRTLGFKE